MRTPTRLRPATLGILLAGLLTSGVASAGAQLTTITPAEVEELQRRGATIVDVRRADEWRATGVVEGSRLITAYDAAGQLSPDFVEQVAAAVEKDRPLVLICRTGNRSGRAAQTLIEEAGFTNVYNVEGGIVEWRSSHRPTASCPDC